MVKTEPSYIPANNKCFSSVYERRMGVRSCVRIPRLLVNKVAVKQHLISVLKLANLNKLDSRQTVREDLWPVLGFPIGIWGNSREM